MVAILTRPGKVRVVRRMELTDRHGVVQEDITSAVGGATVDLDLDRPVSPFLLRGEFLTRGVVVPYRDHIRPWLRLEHPDGTVVDEPVGLYGIAPPQRRHTYTSTRETFEGRDHTWRLATSAVTAPFTVPAGANVVQAVEAILAGQGFLPGDIDITPSAATLTETATWGLDQSVSWLTVCNSLLGAIGYTRLHTTRAGTLRAIPLPDLATAPIAKQYSAASGEVTSEVLEDPNLDLVCNVVRVVNERDGTAPIVAVAENHDPASPVAIETLGRVLFREVRDPNIPDQATAESIARRALQEGATYDNRVTITTGADPTRNPHEIYGFALDRRDSSSVLAGRWRCTGWSLGFGVPDVAMRHQIGQIVPVGEALGEAPGGGA